MRYVVCVKPPGIRTWLDYTYHESMAEAMEQQAMLVAEGVEIGGVRERMPAKFFKR